MKQEQLQDAAQVIRDLPDHGEALPYAELADAVAAFDGSLETLPHPVMEALDGLLVDCASSLHIAMAHDIAPWFLGRALCLPADSPHLQGIPTVEARFRAAWRPIQHGTPRQIAWAERIRTYLTVGMPHALAVDEHFEYRDEEMDERDKESCERVRSIVEFVCGSDSALWWIDNFKNWEPDLKSGDLGIPTAITYAWEDAQKP